MEDQEIVELYWKRDESALERSREKYQSYLTRIAQQILCDRSDSEEVVNDTYFKAWQGMGDLIVTCTSMHSRNRRAGILIGQGRTPQQAMEEKLLVQLLNQFLETLSPQARALFLGRYYYFDPLREVARYCGMGEGQAKSQLFRIRKRLKAYLEQEGFVV